MSINGMYFIASRREGFWGQIQGELGERGGYYLVEREGIPGRMIFSLHEMRKWTFYHTRPGWKSAREDLETLWSGQESSGNLERLEEFLRELQTLDVEHEITAQAVLREWEEWKERKRLSQP